MCCVECHKYEECEENSRLKDNCCSKCPEYHDCVGSDNRRKDSYRNSDYEDYSEN